MSVGQTTAGRMTAAQRPTRGSVFPNRIATLRRTGRVSLPQQELAKSCGLSNRQLRRVEKGYKIPSATCLLRIAHTLSVSVEDLLGTGRNRLRAASGRA